MGKKGDEQAPDSLEQGKGHGGGGQPSAQQSILWQAFTLTFLAEWGDRSQIATIALASAKVAMAPVAPVFFFFSAAGGEAGAGLGAACPWALSEEAPPDVRRVQTTWTLLSLHLHTFLQTWDG